MSSYTTQLRWVVEQALDDMGLARGEENWPRVYDRLGLGDYPIFDEAYRDELNAKIVRRYYTREIGAETVGRFRMFVREAMFLIMPYYNQLYLSELLAKGIDPLSDKGLKTEEHARGTASSRGSGQSSSSSSGQNVYQDTPQSEMIPDMIRSLQYATNVNMDDGKTDSKGSNESSGRYDNELARAETGHSRPQSELLALYRDTFLNIDRMVVEDRELSECFMGVW